MLPLLDALREMMDYEQVKRYMTDDVIEVVPLAYMRGRTLNNAFIIMDEAQNTTPAQMKMFLTRLGENSRMVVTGDPTQTDLPAGAQSGLAEPESQPRSCRRHLGLEQRRRGHHGERHRRLDRVRQP